MTNKQETQRYIFDNVDLVNWRIYCGRYKKLLLFFTLKYIVKNLKIPCYKFICTIIFLNNILLNNRSYINYTRRIY